MEDITLEVLALRIKEIKDGQDELRKQYKSIQETLDSIYEDREILLDIRQSLNKAHEAVLSTDRHNKDLTENVKQTIDLKTRELNDTVKDKVDELKKKQHEVQSDVTTQLQQIDKKASLTYDHLGEQIVKNIYKIFRRERSTLVKKSIVERIKERFKREKKV